MSGGNHETDYHNSGDFGATFSNKGKCRELRRLDHGETPYLEAAGEKTWGGENNYPATHHFDEFWNDTFLVWEMLWRYGWKNENIFVLFGNGHDWTHVPGNYWRYQAENQYYHAPWWIDHITDNGAYYQDVLDVFNYLDGIMEDKDFLFVWTFDHGWRDSIETTPPQILSTIQLMDEEITDAEFASLMPTHYSQRVFWMQQCFSGGFIDNLANDSTVILTAVPDSTMAMPANDDYPDGGDACENDRIEIDSIWYVFAHGEFDYHVFNAASMKTVGYFHVLDSADTDPKDGFTSMKEIKEWEFNKDDIGIPQYSDPGGIGDDIFLNIPPYQPTGFTGARINNHTRLSWARNLEYDLYRYKLYKRLYDHTTQEYSAWLLLASLADTTYLDTTYCPAANGPDSVWYKVAAVDSAGELSEFSNILNSAGFITTQSKGNAISLTSAAGEWDIRCSPNPFNQSTAISYELPTPSHVSLKVYDTAGRLVTTLVGFGEADLQQAGTHQVTFDGTKLASGLYFVRMQAGEFSAVKKMMLVK